MYAMHDKNAAVVTQLNHDEKVTIFEDSYGWGKTYYNDEEVWIALYLLDKDNESNGNSDVSEENETIETLETAEDTENDASEAIAEQKMMKAKRKMPKRKTRNKKFKRNKALKSRLPAVTL